MALPTEPLDWVTRLALMHDRDLPGLRERNELYEGTAPLCYMHPEIQRELEGRLQAVSLGWPMMAVDPLEERLDLLAFRYPEDDDQDPAASPEELASYAGDANLLRVWRDNNLDAEAPMLHVDALSMGRAYLSVGANEADPDTPLVAVESPLEMFAEIDPRTRQPRAALRRWSEYQDDLVRLPEQEAALYLPDMTVWFDRGPNGWREQDRDVHQLGEVLVNPVVNRPRTANRYGASELTPPLLSLSHAGNKLATDMMVGAEFVAIPLRAIFGIGPDDLVDESGNRLSALQVIMGRLLTIPAEDGNLVKPHEFSASTLDNFHTSIRMLAERVGSLLGLPPSGMGLTSDNPASADAIRAAEARLIKRAERRQTWYSPGYRRTAWQVRRLQEGGGMDPRARRLETIWRDAATPTRAQAADAAVKLLVEGVTTKRQAREDMGYTPGQIRRMEAEDAAEAERSPLAVATRTLGQRMEPPDGMPAEPALVE